MEFDTDEGELFEAFRSLRSHIVRVSDAFGARLAVRLRALRAAEGHADPSIAEVFGATVLDALSIMSAPLNLSSDAQAPPEPPDDDTAAQSSSDEEESSDE